MSRQVAGDNLLAAFYLLYLEVSFPTELKNMGIFNILAMVAFVVLLVFDSTLVQFKALGFLVIFLGYSVFRETQRVSFKLDELYEQISDLQEVLQKRDETGIEVVEEEK